MGIKLENAGNKQAYAKVGIMGFQGSGKTFTASLIAIGLLKEHEKRTKQKMKCLFLDTETGSDFINAKFEEAGYELLVARTRAFIDVLDVFKAAREEGCLVIIIDSLTHIWRDLTESYKRKKKVNKLSFHHWGDIKEEWGKFSDKFITFPIHTIVCGRAGYEYEWEEDDDGKKELIKTGTKMKAESEFGFEPNLSIEMYLRRKEDEAGKQGAKMENVAFVMKDRSDKINFKEFPNPKFEDFSPHWSALNIGGEHESVDIMRNSEALFQKDDYTYRDRKIKREVLVEEIKNELTNQQLGKTEAAKAFMNRLFKAIFDTHSWTAIENMDVGKLADGHGVLLSCLQEVCDVFRDGGDFDVTSIVNQHRERIYEEEAKKAKEKKGIPDNTPEDIPF